MTLPARLLWGIKLRENLLEVVHFDICFDKIGYRRFLFSYKNNDIIAACLLYGMLAIWVILNNGYILQSKSVSL